MSERYGQPWKVDSERTTVIRDSKQSKVAWVTALGRGQIAAEDAARLIAAAPDMEEALVEIRDRLRNIRAASEDQYEEACGNGDAL